MASKSIKPKAAASAAPIPSAGLMKAIDRAVAALRDLERERDAMLLQAEMESRPMRPISDLGLSKGVADLIVREGVTMIDDLVLLSDDEIMSIRGFGAHRLNEVRKALSDRGLRSGIPRPDEANIAIRKAFPGA